MTSVICYMVLTDTLFLSTKETWLALDHIPVIQSLMLKGYQPVGRLYDHDTTSRTPGFYIKTLRNYEERFIYVQTVCRINTKEKRKTILEEFDRSPDNKAKLKEVFEKAAGSIKIETSS